MFPAMVVYSLRDFPEYEPVDPSNRSFESNAAEKATAAAQALKKPCIADESGLVVPFLGLEQESLKRKQMLPKDKKLPDTGQLLQDLAGVSEADREAFLECTLALFVPGKGLVRLVSARMEGSIALEERGPASFDFASVFIKYDYSKQLSMLSEAVLFRISHRQKACEKLRTAIRESYS